MKYMDSLRTKPLTSDTDTLVLKIVSFAVERIGLLLKP